MGAAGKSNTVVMLVYMHIVLLLGVNLFCDLKSVALFAEKLLIMFCPKLFSLA